MPDATVLYPPLDDNDTAARLEHNFQTLLQCNGERRKSPEARQLAQATSVLATNEIARMQRAVQELELLLMQRENNDSATSMDLAVQTTNTAMPIMIAEED
jgi:hypothetical protein